MAYITEQAIKNRIGIEKYNQLAVENIEEIIAESDALVDHYLKLNELDLSDIVKQYCSTSIAVFLILSRIGQSLDDFHQKNYENALEILRQENRKIIQREINE